MRQACRCGAGAQVHPCTASRHWHHLPAALRLSLVKPSARAAAAGCQVVLCKALRPCYWCSRNKCQNCRMPTCGTAAALHGLLHTRKGKCSTAHESEKRLRAQWRTAMTACDGGTLCMGDCRASSARTCMAAAVILLHGGSMTSSFGCATVLLLLGVSWSSVTFHNWLAVDALETRGLLPLRLGPGTPNMLANLLRGPAAPHSILSLVQQCTVHACGFQAVALRPSQSAASLSSVASSSDSVARLPSRAVIVAEGEKVLPFLQVCTRPLWLCHACMYIPRGSAVMTGRGVGTADKPWHVCGHRDS